MHSNIKVIDLLRILLAVAVALAGLGDCAKVARETHVERPAD